MPLINFGSILGFAEEMEKEQKAFFDDAAGNPALAAQHGLCRALAKTAGKRIKEVQRVRRENVTEMILETIQGFTRAPYVLEGVASQEMDDAAFTQKSRALIERALAYYEAAAEKLKGQADVARALKVLAKQQTKDLKKLM
jgi:hypothetical protein